MTREDESRGLSELLDISIIALYLAISELGRHGMPRTAIYFYK
jgi:hypothetical protein